MSAFNHLPIRILKRILWLVIYKKAYYLSKWKKKLPIIGVCQNWRYFGLDYVYNQAFFVEYGAYLKQDTTLRRRRGQYLYRRGLPNKKPILFSNIDLLIMLDRCYTVQTIDIIANTSTPQHSFIDGVFRLLQQTRCDWSRVNSLHLNQNYRLEELITDYYLIGSKDKEYDLKPFIEYAKAKFTAITHVSHGSNSNLLMYRLCTELQLLNLDFISGYTGNMSLLTSFKYVPQNITYLYVYFDKTEEVLYLPIIYAESLKSLTLIDLPPTFDWSSFHNPILLGSTSIVFKNLRNLYVFYATGYMDSNLVCDQPGPSNGFYIKFLFSILEELQVSNCSVNNSLLHAKFPNKARLVNYTGSISSIALCQQIKIKSSNFFINVTSADKSERDTFYNMTNSMFTDYNNKSDICFLFEGIMFSIDVDLIKWGRLSLLRLDINIEFSPFLLLLQKLPYLNDIDLQHNSILSLLSSFDLGLANAVKYNPDSIICPNLKHIYISEDYNPYHHNTMLALIKFLIDICPNIEGIETDYIFKKELEDYLSSCDRNVSPTKEFVINYRLLFSSMHKTYIQSNNTFLIL